MAQGLRADALHGGGHAVRSLRPAGAHFVRHAPARLVWGSDWPHVNRPGRAMPNDGDLLDLMLEWVPDEAVRNRILAANANTLYGFPLA